MPRTGRPREFDRDKAVQAAMELFWEHGYEPTSLSQLKACMGGISSASFYAAFGSKEALFQEGLAKYLATHGQVMTPLHDPSLKPRDAVEQALRRSARMQSGQDHPLGCFVTLSTTNCSPENRHLRTLVEQERERNRTALADCIQRAVDCGDLRADTDTAGLATLLNTFLLGISLEARDGTAHGKLDAAASQLMRMWDALAEPKCVQTDEPRRRDHRR
ncbi:TetR family transcriptional regulator [Pseudoroseomonas wenyumeiae]|uniref:TetR family transcriptional regulator n=1 Tax=Teichococcus wenyumeiae TaxID=2478470 RepID=A0A3A9J4I4_9PROT|nr:TetR/AcrR family transcriptional regulator [Pseudoroseomonas wenyumeiae]RKK01362.1 TetR/AcrR family transcriptional regulator [Pseudoroseomonas wenyumeiae]RMI14719.1 TetR family transcriptional regulator [Pseudoroseomonas wenyumeiae]